MVTAKQRQDVLNALSKIDMDDRFIFLETLREALCLECGRIVEGQMEVSKDCPNCSE